MRDGQRLIKSHVTRAPHSFWHVQTCAFVGVPAFMHGRMLRAEPEACVAVNAWSPCQAGLGDVEGGDGSSCRRSATRLVREMKERDETGEDE